VSESLVADLRAIRYSSPARQRCQRESAIDDSLELGMEWLQIYVAPMSACSKSIFGPIPKVYGLIVANVFRVKSKTTKLHLD